VTGGNARSAWDNSCELGREGRAVTGIVKPLTVMSLSFLFLNIKELIIKYLINSNMSSVMEARKKSLKQGAAKRWLGSLSPERLH
jgi:hypothetical protein